MCSREMSSTSRWTAKLDQASGKTYYVNRETKETSWTKPAGLVDAEVLFVSPVLPAKIEGSGFVQGTPNKVLDSTAASNWARRVDYKTGQTYFYNVTSGEIRWVDPSQIVAFLEMPLSAEAVYCFGGNERPKEFVSSSPTLSSYCSCEMFDGKRWHPLQVPKGRTNEQAQPLNPRGQQILPFDMESVCAVRIGPSTVLLMGKRVENGAVICQEWNSMTLEVTPRHDLAGLLAAGCAYGSIPRGILACGGFLDETMKVVADDAMLMDMSRSTPLLLPKMNVARASHSLVVVDVSTPTRLFWFAYAIGGFDGTTKSAVVERYVLGEAKWEIMQSLSIPRSGHCSVAHNRTVFVFGGRSGYKVTDTGEFMHVQTDTWLPTKAMRSARASFGCVSLDPYIIVAGGWNGVAWIAAVEAYDPRIDVWRDVVSLPSPKSMMGLSVLTKRPDPAE